MVGGAVFADSLDRVPSRRMRRRLVRCVPALDFLESRPPTYLYTSGRPNRCNPRGVECLYFSETERIAAIEYRRAFAGTSTADAPRLTFVAQVDLRRVVDLEKPDVRRILGLSTADLIEPWRGVTSPTRLQQLGLAISGQRLVAAIRYSVRCLSAVGCEGLERGDLPGDDRDAVLAAYSRDIWQAAGRIAPGDSLSTSSVGRRWGLSRRTAVGHRPRRVVAGGQKSRLSSSARGDSVSSRARRATHGCARRLQCSGPSVRQPRAGP